MNTLQLSIDLSFEQLVAIVKQLPAKDKQKLNDIVWGEDYPIPEAYLKSLRTHIRKVTKNPDHLVSWAEVKKRLRSKK